MDEVAAYYIASALYTQAAKKDEVEQTEKELAILDKIFALDSRFSAYFSHPFASQTQKLGLLRKIISSQMLIKFLGQLIEKRFFGFLPNIFKAYKNIACAKGGISRASVKTANTLTSQATEKFVSAVQKIAGTKADIEFLEDPALLGGVVVKIDNKVYDGSIKREMELLKERLLIE